MADRQLAQCDPDGEKPCCNAVSDGWCGETPRYCNCSSCTDYSRLYREWRESKQKQKWRYDRKCGSYYVLPDGTVGQCNPDGKSPCCSDKYNGRCLHPTDQSCSCAVCTDFRDLYKYWREGLQKWRSDGRCGVIHVLPDGTPSECDPDSLLFCCNSYKDGRCVTGEIDDGCMCKNCVHYQIVRKVRESRENCTVARLQGGFLKNVCFDEKTKQQYFKCTHSDVYYKAWYTFATTLSQVSAVCENDPFVYQACGFETPKTNSDVLCGGYICGQRKEDGDAAFGYVKCLEDDCRTEKRTCKRTEDFETVLCDDKCDSETCLDESFCNEYKYGVTCILERTLDQGYVPAYRVCDGTSDCEIIGGAVGEDEQNCTVENSTVYSCVQYWRTATYREDRIVPILNYTRCSLFDLVSDFKERIRPAQNPYCSDYLDQTNCSDPLRVGGYCRVKGFMSSVSKYMVCNDYDELRKVPIQLCDDDSQNWCDSPFTDCRIHKHWMCDMLDDCPDRSDELLDQCSLMTNPLDFECSRRFNPRKEKAAIPISWIMDGKTDCMSGEDEDSSRWQFCKGESRQLLSPGGKCLNYYKCAGSDESYVLFDQLCDGLESCGDGTENEVCRIARDFPVIDKIAPRHNERRNLCHGSSCEAKTFFPHGHLNEVFGVEKKTEVLVPTFKTECKTLFGEYYLLLSCTDLCLEPDVKCPLDHTNNILMYDSCPGQFPGRSYTVLNNSKLTFVVDTESGRYHQDFYQCKNSRCVEYEKVCDLINDCGDMSDEINCTNHMICDETLNTTKHQFISLAQRCDGIYDCFDLSDECNDSCGREILENLFLKIICWLMGVLALSFNYFSLFRGFGSLLNCETQATMTSKTLMTLIGLGDFLIGTYLVILSVFDSIVLGGEFCRHQAEWLTGTTCLTLGVISTLGSQISLFTMTMLSVIRMYGITFRSLKTSEPINKKYGLKLISLVVIIVLAALVIAVTPLAPSLEEYFVQGMYYDPAYKIFVGFPNKPRHIKVLQTYYMKNTTKSNASDISPRMSWQDIDEYVAGMFSQDYGKITRRPVHFYGNDGVCLFKYFVRTDDARRSRQLDDSETGIADPVVWFMLAVNLFCFIIITFSYVVIFIKSRGSSQDSGQSENPERMRAEKAMQTTIMTIIATDFLCWVPFIGICALHNVKYIDASSWYASFVMTALPLNSVINPTLYEKAIREKITHTLEKLRKLLTSSAEWLRAKITGLFQSRRNEKQQVTINLEPVNRDDNEANQ